MTGLNVNYVIHVEGGDSLDADDFDGSISLNNVTCHQWRTEYTGPTSMWPYSYWDCADPDDAPTAYEARVADAANGLPDDFKTVLSNVSLYIFDTGSDHNYFFQPSSWVGATAYGAQVSSLEYAAVFDTVTVNGSPTDVSEFARGAAMHEFAHLLDAYSSFPSQQTGAGTFGAASSADQTSIAASTCAAVFGSAGNPFCGSYGNPWLALHGKYINPQNTNSEMFAFGFQNCSGFAPEPEALNNAEGSMTEINKYFDGNPTGTDSFWPGGCP